MKKQKCAYSTQDLSFGLSQQYGVDLTTKDVDAYTKRIIQMQIVPASSRQRIVQQVKARHEGLARDTVRLLDGYAARCRDAGHHCEIMKKVGHQVKAILTKSFKTEYNRQFKNVKEENRDPFIIPDWVGEIKDDNIHAMGFAFSHQGFLNMRRTITIQKTYSDACFRTSNVEKGCHSWIGILDANHQLTPLMDAHDAQTESNVTWRTAFGLLNCWDPSFSSIDGGLLYDIYGNDRSPASTSSSLSVPASSSSSSSSGSSSSSSRSVLVHTVVSSTVL